MPRLFTAIDLPDAVAQELEVMRGGVAGARWIDQENYHITLRFIGEIDGNVAYELSRALASIDACPFTMRLKGLGSFGGKKPRAIWAGVEAPQALQALQHDHERLCQRIGLEPVTRKFTPHVTLARLRQSRRDDVENFLTSHSLYESNPFEVTGFVLYSSRPSRGGGPYVAEEVYPFSPAI